MPHHMVEYMAQTTAIAIQMDAPARRTTKP